MLRVLVFLLLSVSAFAQGWTSTVAFDTGWYSPSDEACSPVANEPASWSTPQVVPCPPPGAFMVQTVIESVEYRAIVTAANLTNAPAWYRVRPTYSYRLGHVPGLYHSGGHVYAAGHGTEDASRFMAAGIQAGTGPAERWLDAGGSETWEPHTIFDGPLAVEIQPISPEWMTQRRGAHLLYSTAQGAYQWEAGPWPAGHSPISYSITAQVRLRGTVRYALP